MPSCSTMCREDSREKLPPPPAARSSRAFRRAQALGAGGEQRVDGGRHLQTRQLGSGGPPVPLWISAV